MNKVCRRCGIEKPIEEFREYYNGSGRRYTFCKQCERIETRRKYLRKKPELSIVEQQELNAIEELYKRRAAKGLSVPGERTSRSVISIVEEELNENM